MKSFASNRLGTSVASFAVPALLALASTGCDDALTRVDLVANLRVLGARVEVDGEPGRASPLPGETASVRWLVADRHPEPPLGWTLSACEAAPPGSSLPSCAAEPFATASADVPVAGEPRIDLVVPEETTAGALALFGVVCPDSEPVATADSLDCAGPGGRLVSLDFILGTDSLVNTNPTIDPEAFELDGVAMPEGLDCATLPTVARSSSHELELRLEESDRDAIDPTSSAEPPKEELQVSHFTTAGKLERAFTVFEASDTNLAARVSWKAPSEVPLDGFARLFFVVRDMRGGSDWIERAVCIE